MTSNQQDSNPNLPKNKLKAVVDKYSPHVLTLAKYNSTPKVHFEAVSLGSARRKSLIIRNTNDKTCKIKFVKPPPDQFKFSCDPEPEIKANEEIWVEIIWTPKEVGSVFELIQFTSQQFDYKVSLHLLGNCIAPQFKRKESSIQPPITTKTKQSPTMALQSILKKKKFGQNSQAISNINSLNWVINEEMGHFQSEFTSDNDDLYVFNITLVVAYFLHLLPISPNTSEVNENDYWMVTFNLFGCEIHSDPFQLGKSDYQNDSRKAFIGDKASARVRASGALFNDFLMKNTIEFRVLRCKDEHFVDFYQMGISYVQLNELAKPNIDKLKVTLEMISEWDTTEVNQIPSNKPEIKILIELKTLPNFFKSWMTLIKNEPKTADSMTIPLVPSKSSTSTYKSTEKAFREIETTHIPRDRGDSVDFSSSSFHSSKAIKSNIRATSSPPPVQSHISLKDDIFGSLKNMQIKNASSKSPDSNANIFKEIKKKYSLSPQKLNSEIENKFQTFRREEEKEKIKKKSSPVISATSATATSNTYSPTSSSGVETSPTSKEIDILDIPVCENSQEGFFNFEPGNYEVTIELEGFWLKSKGNLKNDMKVTYVLPSIGIDKPIICTASPNPEVMVGEDENKKYCQIYEGSWRALIQINSLTKKMIEDPIKVEFQQQSGNTFGYSLISFGAIFLTTPRQKVRMIKGSDKIYKQKDGIKVGELFYSLILQPPTTTSPAKKSPKVKIPVKSPKTPEMKTQATHVVDKILREHNLEENKRDIELEAHYHEKFQDKVNAYLKLLSKEYNLRQAEQDEMIKKKFDDMDKKEKDLDKVLKRVTEKEEKLNSKSNDMELKIQMMDRDKKNLTEDTELKIKRLKNTHEIEIESLEKKINVKESEINNLQGKLNYMEKRLKIKEDELEVIKESRNKWPDMQLAKKVELLEEKNNFFQEEVTQLKKAKEQYKTYAKFLSDKLEMVKNKLEEDMKTENEQLRFQLFAANEKKEILNERNTIRELSDEIRALRKTKTKPV